MTVLSAVGETVSASSVTDSSVVTFVVDTAKQIIGILTTPPLGVFITIGIIGAVIGIVGGVVHMAKRR